MERAPTKRRWERDWIDLVRLGLLMRRMALDWTGLDFVEKTESRFWSTTPDVGAVL